MSGSDKTREQLLEEVAGLRRQLADVEAAAGGKTRGAEAALRESERAARALVDAQHESAFLLELDATIVTLNETAARRLGGTPEQLVGRSLAEFFPPDVLQRRLAQAQEVIRTGKPVRAVDERDGVWFDYTIYPAFGEQGEVVRWAVYARDITLRKTAEANLQKREAILQAISIIARTLLEPGAFDSALSEILHLLGEALNVNRAWVISVKPGADDEVYARLISQWCAPGVPTTLEHPLFTDFPQRASGYGRWVDLFSSGESVYGLVEDFPECERALLERFDIKALAAIPIVVGGEWWGAVGFDNSTSGQSFTTAELDTLATAAEILGAAINRQRLENLLGLQRDVALGMAASIGVGEAMGRVLDTLAGFQWAEVVGLYLADEETGVLELSVHQGLTAESAQIVASAEPGTPEYDLLVSDEPRCLTIAALKPSPQVDDLLGLGLKAVVTLPVRSERTLVAVMALGSRHQDTVSPAVMDSLEVICSQVGDHIARLRAEEAVRQSEEKFRTLAEQSVLGIAVMRDRRFVFVNNSFARIFGHEPGALLAMAPEEIASHIHPEDREMVFERMVARQAGREVPGQYEFRIIRRDGSEGYVETSANLVIHGGRPAVQAVLNDITERILAENALRQSEEKFRLLIEKSIQGLMVIQDARIVLTNQAFAGMIGYSVKELLDLPADKLADTIHADDRAEIMSRLRSRVEGGDEPRHYKARALHKDGRAVWVDVVSDIIEYGGRSATQVLTVDITEQKKLEDQILQSHKMEAVGRLAGGVAHDFNNLLTAIRGYGKSLSRKMAGNDPLREEVDEICFAADRATSLTRQLLSFSRKQVPRPELIQLNQVVLDMEGLIRRLIGRKIEVVTQLGKGLGMVRADRSQVEQILMNLVVNARDAMDQGGQLEIETGQVELERRPVAREAKGVNGPCVKLSVSDNGVGLTQNEIDRLFEPFFSTKAPGRGTGLGLSVVYWIVEQHGGLVEVESEPGKGTRFHIYLPIAPPEQLEGHGESVLLVEDEGGIRKLVTVTLKDACYEVAAAASAEEALGIIEQRAKPFDLMVSDVVLPGLSGVQLVEELRDRGADLRVMMISGFTLDDEHMQYIDEHRIRLLPKPFSSDELLACIREELSRGGS